MESATVLHIFYGHPSLRLKENTNLKKEVKLKLKSREKKTTYSGIRATIAERVRHLKSTFILFGVKDFVEGILQ